MPFRDDLYTSIFEKVLILISDIIDKNTYVFPKPIYKYDHEDVSVLRVFICIHGHNILELSFYIDTYDETFYFGFRYDIYKSESFGVCNLDNILYEGKYYDIINEKLLTLDFNFLNKLKSKIRKSIKILLDDYKRR